MKKEVVQSEAKAEDPRITEIRERIQKAQVAIDDILKEHNVALDVNPNSPLNNIQIIIRPLK